MCNKCVSELIDNFIDTYIYIPIRLYRLLYLDVYILLMLIFDMHAECVISVLPKKSPFLMYILNVTVIDV